MLVIKTTMTESRTAEQKEALIWRISEAAAKELGWPLEEVRVVIYEASKETGASPGARRQNGKAR